MFDRDRVLALDVGASKIVLAEFRLSKGAAPVLLKYGVSPVDGEDSNESARLAFIVTAIRDLMHTTGMRPAPLLMSISGQAVFPRFVKLPSVGKEKLSQIIQYEAEQNVPFPMEEVVWDYQLIGGDSGELNVMLVAAKIENVKRLTDCVEAAGLEPDIVDVSPMALYNAVRCSRPDLSGCAMILDIGARSSNLIFMEDSRIFSRSIPVAGNAITQELMKEFDVSFAEAEQLKHEVGFVAFGGVYAGPDNETAERASKIIRSVLTRLHAEVNRSVNFYRSQQGGNPPSVVLLAGGSSLISHLDTFFQDKLKVPVEYLNPFTSISVSAEVDADALNDDLHCMGEVAGLVLRETGACQVEINLMPPELVALKVFRRRKPYFAMSAAGVVLALLCWWGYFLRMSTMLEERSDVVHAEIQGFVSKQNALKDSIAERETYAERFQDVANLIDQRTQWIALLKDIRSCLQPGMWLTSVAPETRGNQIQQVTITVQAFTDRLQNTAQGTATELFRNRLRETPAFSENSEIVSETPVGSYLRRFSIRLELETPINVL